MINGLSITQQKLDALRERVVKILSERRATHTLGVERMAARLARIYCPDKELKLRAMALLHDITKELSVDEHFAIFARYGVEPSELLAGAPSLLHAVTASLCLPDEYPDFADVETVDAVRYHTTGRADMTLAEKIIYLADYIEDNRTYDDCVYLRNAFFGADIEGMSNEEKEQHLDRILLLSFDMTLRDLVSRNKTISSDTQMARDHLENKLKSKRG
jgi:nicotinate-nucleotide adenylyltransferase